jgi:hypothetical protein
LEKFVLGKKRAAQPLSNQILKHIVEDPQDAEFRKRKNASSLNKQKLAKEILKKIEEENKTSSSSMELQLVAQDSWVEDSLSLSL